MNMAAIFIFSGMAGLCIFGAAVTALDARRASAAGRAWRGDFIAGMVMCFMALSVVVFMAMILTAAGKLP